MLLPLLLVPFTEASSGYNKLTYEESLLYNEDTLDDVSTKLEWTLVSAAPYLWPTAEAPMELLRLSPRTGTPRPTEKAVDMIILNAMRESTRRGSRTDVLTQAGVAHTVAHRLTGCDPPTRRRRAFPEEE